MVDRTAPEQGAWHWPEPAGSQWQQMAANHAAEGPPAGPWISPTAAQPAATQSQARQIPHGTVSGQPYSHGKRAGYGVLWAAWTAVLTIGGFAELFGGQVLGGLFALALAALAGRYDYRIWTWQARRLLFFILW